MGVITPRPVDSPAIGTGSLPRGCINITMANSKTFINSTGSEGNSNTHICISNANSYCYICGEFKLQKNLRTFSVQLQALYQQCFGCVVNRENENWLPSATCSTCKTMLHRYESKRRMSSFCIQQCSRNPKVNPTAIFA